MIKIIQFINVSKSFNGKLVLNDFNFTFNNGNTYFLYGNSGSGKTTIFTLLLGEEHPDNGEIKICGDDIKKFSKNDLLTYRQQIGIVWQNLLLIKEKTVFENISLPLVLKGENSHSIKNKVMEILEESNFIKEKDKFPTELTLGQKQIIAILRAIITNPKIILLDEPMNHLDTQTEKNIWNLINKYKDPNAVTIFTTSQKYIVENFEGNIIDMPSL